MNDYREITINVEPCTEVATDILAALLADIGFESFSPEEKGLKAYIKEELYSVEQMNEALTAFPLEAQLSFVDTFVEGKDWNEEWEKNYFKPIVVGNECVIHSTFHTDVPVATYDIVIDPKMAFGTGHHATTSLILGEILRAELADKTVLDMGCGTAVLAILARMRGAANALAIDIDPWAYENALENVKLNNITDVTIQLGGAELLAQAPTFDVVFANINRNILLADLHAYAKVIHSGSEIYMSGFYEEDIAVIRAEAEKQGLTYCHYNECNKWVAVKFVKP